MNFGVTRLLLSGVFEVGGVGAITWGFALLSPTAGFIAGGVGAILIGLSVDPPRRTPKQLEEPQQ